MATIQNLPSFSSLSKEFFMGLYAVDRAFNRLRLGGPPHFTYFEFSNSVFYPNTVNTFLNRKIEEGVFGTVFQNHPLHANAFHFHKDKAMGFRDQMQELVEELRASARETQVSWEPMETFVKSALVQTTKVAEAL